MAIIQINHQKINFNENDYLNLKSLLPRLQKEFPREQFDISSFKVNGQSIDHTSEDPNLIRPISGQDFIEINFDQSPLPLKEIINDLSIIVDKTLLKISNCSNYLKNDDNFMAKVQLGIIVDAVNTFIHAFNHVLSTTREVAPDEENNLPIRELQIHLLSIMKAITSAFKCNDLIMLTDLLEYELRDNLTQWKILIIPNIKKYI